MNRVALSALVLSSAMAAGCGQRLLDFYNNHADAAASDLSLADMNGVDMNGVDMNGVDMSGVDAAGEDLGVGDMAEPDLSVPDMALAEDMQKPADMTVLRDFTVPADMTTLPDLYPPCIALSVPGAGSIVTATHTPDIYTPTGALTVEAWIYSQASGKETIVAHTGNTASGDLGYFLYTGSDNSVTFAYSQDGTSYATVTSLATFQSNTWTHVVGEFSPTPLPSLRVAVDGGLPTVAPLLSATASPAIAQPVTIGSLTAVASPGDAVSFIGFEHDVRISNVVRYTAAFTPQKTLAKDDNTLLLYHFTDTVGSTTFTDSSVNDVTGQGANNAKTAMPPVCD